MGLRCLVCPKKKNHPVSPSFSLTDSPLISPSCTQCHAKEKTFTLPASANEPGWRALPLAEGCPWSILWVAFGMTRALRSSRCSCWDPVDGHTVQPCHRSGQFQPASGRRDHCHTATVFLRFVSGTCREEISLRLSQECLPSGSTWGLIRVSQAGGHSSPSLGTRSSQLYSETQ